MDLFTQDELQTSFFKNGPIFVFSKWYNSNMNW